MKKLFFGLAIIALAGAAVYRFYLLPNNTSDLTNTTSLSDTLAGTSTPTTPTSSVPLEELIKYAIAAKYNLPKTKINIVVGSRTDTYAKGTVNIEGEGGGIFLAAFQDNTWKLVDDGNGIVTCDKISPYKFPSSMVPQCLGADGNLVKNTNP